MNLQALQLLNKKQGVSFKFKKSNGEIRKAVGTINPSVLGFDDPIDLKNGNVRYFDTEKKAVRSFKIKNFMGV